MISRATLLCARSNRTPLSPGVLAHLLAKTFSLAPLLVNLESTGITPSDMPACGSGFTLHLLLPSSVSP